MTNTKQALLAVALATLSLQAAAHRPWLLPSLTFVEGKEPTVLVDGAVSENLFDFDHVALKMDGATVTDPDGVVTPTPAATMQKRRSSVELTLAKPGTYKVSMASQTVTASWKEGAETRRWRGPETAYAKEVPANAQDLKATRQQARMETFITLDKPSSAALKPSGSGLEMVPLTHPNDMRAGETAKWRFLLDGKPLANFPFSLLPGGVRHRGVMGEIRLGTDANGEASVQLPAGGMYWLSASYPAGLAKGEAPKGPDPRRYSYSATLEVLPE
jgi:uncharacterized GH25 family protein